MNNSIIAIGIGCRKNCSVAEIIELIHTALEKIDMVVTDITVMATAWVKEKEDCIINSADALDIPLVIISKEKCEEMAGMEQTVSQKVIELFSIPSVAETAALAAAGKGAKLICSRVNSASATCAIALGEG
ncbi:MAG: cobalamin biosynthesis protein [Rickettsiales bacterium]